MTTTPLRTSTAKPRSADVRNTSRSAGAASHRVARNPVGSVARDPEGSLLDVPDRIVVAPRTGVFIPLEPTAGLGPGTTVRSGQLIGHLRCGDEVHRVTSPFAGVARDMLALPNERVRQYQPLLWMAAGAG